MSIIHIQHLSKHFKVSLPGKGVSGKIKSFIAPEYKVIKAVDDISLEVATGEIIGYLGPNGAGKSTTIKLLTGVLTPTSGYVEVNGLVPYKKRTQNAYNIGVVYGQRTQLWWDLPLIDSFEFLRAMYRISATRYKANLDALIELLKMQEFIDQPVRKLSLGQRMRGDIAAALLHDPPILYLDEPTIGLDVSSKNRVLQFLRDLNAERGTVIVFTSHNLFDVEQLCPRIVIIDNGHVLLDAMQEEVLAQFGKYRELIVEFENGVKDIAIPEGQVIKNEDNKLWIRFDRNRITAIDLISYLGKHEGIRDVAIKEENIETVVTRIYNELAK